MVNPRKPAARFAAGFIMSVIPILEDRIPKMLKKLLAVLKRLGIRPAIAQDYLNGFPSRPGQQPKITPKFEAAQLAIAPERFNLDRNLFRPKL